MSALPPPASGDRGVAGYCPACGATSLMLAAGGYVTCSRIECPDPEAVSKELGVRPERGTAFGVRPHRYLDPEQRAAARRFAEAPPVHLSDFEAEELRFRVAAPRPPEDVLAAMLAAVEALPAMREAMEKRDAELLEQLRMEIPGFRGRLEHGHLVVSETEALALREHLGAPVRPGRSTPSLGDLPVLIDSKDQG